MKLNRHTLIALALLLFATGLRVMLAALGWPATNSDEGTMAIMAMNIAAHRDYPLMFYGQNYMGTVEAYLGAVLFWLSGGPSLFALRLGVILLVALFLLCIYLLARLLFSKRLALVTLLTLSIGSSSIFLRHIIATGGSAETLLFGALACLLASWLALTARNSPVAGLERRWNRRRLLAYTIWGLVIGLGCWSDMIVLPFFSMALLLLVLFCWRELWPWRWLLVLGGALVGMLPELIFDIQRRLNPVQVLFSLTQGTGAKAPQTLPGILHNLFATLQVSLPTATGQPFCPVMEVPAWGPNTPDTWSCILVRTCWGTGYLLLLGAALTLTIIGLRRLRFNARDILSGGGVDGGAPASVERHQALVRMMARLLLLAAALLALVVYALSSGPVDQPGFHARYLVTLLLATPAVLSPLWYAAERAWSASLPLMSRLRTIAARAALGCIWLLLLTGTLLTLLDVPQARAGAQNRQDLLHDLTHLGITHFYTDYWTCYDLIVASNEGVICAVLDTPRLGLIHNRAPRYYDIVSNDPQAALVFPRDSAQLRIIECQFVGAAPTAYRRTVADDYVIYQPVLGGKEQPIDLEQAIGLDGVRIWRPGCGPVTATSGK